MTPYELDATIARLRELDARRTPGRWLGVAVSAENPPPSGPEGDQGGFISRSQDSPNPGHVGDFDEEADALFAAEAPEMMAVIDALQAENARLIQAHMEGGFRVGELMARLLDSDAALYKCWEMIAERNRLIDDLQAKLLDAERRDSELQARARIATNNVNDAKIALGTLMTAFPDHQVIAGAYTSTLRALKALDEAGLPAPYLTSTSADEAHAPSSSGS